MYIHFAPSAIAVHEFVGNSEGNEAVSYTHLSVQTHSGEWFDTNDVKLWQKDSQRVSLGGQM